MHILLTSFLLPEVESEFYRPQQKASEEAAFQTSKASAVTRHGLWCSILEELWQDPDPAQRDGQNQIPPWSPGASLNKKTARADRDCGWKEPGKTTPFVANLFSTQKGAPRLLAKRLNPNLEANGEEQGSVTKQLNGLVTSAHLLPQDSSNANCTILRETWNPCKGNQCRKVPTHKQLTEKEAHSREKLDEGTECRKVFYDESAFCKH